MKGLNICVDIDGTITDEYYWLKLTNWYFNKNITKEEVTKYYIHEVLGITEMQYLDFYERYKYSMHEGQKVREDVKEILDLLSESHKIFFVTARDTSIEMLTHRYLRKHEIPFHDLFVLGHSHKVEKARELNCNIFIEDNPETAMELSENGFKVLLMDTTYNRLAAHENITRVKDWNEIYFIIEKMLLHQKAM